MTERESLMQQQWGLVLAGGGGKGAYQIGAYKALAEHGMDKQIVGMAGSSVGTLNMALLAMDDLKMAQYVWSHISPNQFLEAEIGKMFDGREGFVSRDGLVEIMDNYINWEILYENSKPMFATLSRYKDYVTQEAESEYVNLNKLERQQAKQIMLASSALPFVYEPVKIGNYVYRDGGLTDNLPIRPLYESGIRHFILILLSQNTKVPRDTYPDADFLEIRPSTDLGDLWRGTLDFTSNGAKIRMELGYVDAMRAIRYFGREELNTAEFQMQIREAAQREYQQICNKYKIESMESDMKERMEMVQGYFDRYDVNL